MDGRYRLHLCIQAINRPIRGEVFSLNIFAPFAHLIQIDKDLEPVTMCDQRREP